MSVAFGRTARRARHVSLATLDQLAPSTVRDFQPSTVAAGQHGELDVVVRFSCDRSAHLVGALPGVAGSLVVHHGTFGYCPGPVWGDHHWRRVISMRLAELPPEAPCSGVEVASKSD